MDFIIVKLLNLEEYFVFEYVMWFGEKEGVDLLIVIDFDVDCLGVVVCLLNGFYEVLIGN